MRCPHARSSLRSTPLLATLALAGLLGSCEDRAASEVEVEAGSQAGDAGADSEVPAAESTSPAAAPAGTSDGTPSTPSTRSAKAGEPLTGQAALEALRANAAATAARPEHQADVVEVAHILVSFAGAGTQATRTQEQAEQLAAELFARVDAGEDFESVRVANTDDPGDASYTMSLGNQARAIPRRAMVPAFGDVGWRLEVGQLGVAPFDQAKSRYGWHIIKRLK